VPKSFGRTSHPTNNLLSLSPNLIFIRKIYANTTLIEHRLGISRMHKSARPVTLVLSQQQCS
jgi:hypothetical protein